MRRQLGHLSVATDSQLAISAASAISILLRIVSQGCGSAPTSLMILVTTVLWNLAGDPADAKSNLASVILLEKILAVTADISAQIRREGGVRGGPQPIE